MPIFKNIPIQESTVEDLSTIDEIMNFQITKPIRLNEDRIVKEMLECYGGNMTIMESEVEKDVDSFSVLKNKFKEYVSTKDLEKEYTSHLKSRASSILRFSFLSRTAVKNPTIKMSHLKEIKKMNAKIKGDICKIYELGADEEDIAKLKKALLNIDITDKYVDDKETVTYTYTIDTDNIDIEETKLMANSTPYYTIEEIRGRGRNLSELSLDLDDKTPYSEWLECVDMLSKGLVHSKYTEYYPKWVDKVQSLMKEDTDIARESIINLGWNPSIEFNLENRIEASKRFRTIVERFNNILDATNMSDVTVTTENVFTKTKSPVYVVITYTKSPFGKLTQKLTNATYTHAGFSFSPNLDKIYSYNMSVNGFSIEDIKSYNRNEGSVMALYTILVDNKQIKKIKNYIDTEIGAVKDSIYSIPTLLGILINKPIHLNNGMICSQFVDSVFKHAGIDITKKDSALVTPQDFRDTKQKFFIKVYEGSIAEYAPNKIENKISKIMTSNFKFIKEEYIEEKELPVRFDKDGNILINKLKKGDYESEFAACHSLLLTYEKSGNTEAIKYELCKLWFMNCLIQEELHSKKISDKKRNELNKARAKIMNDFIKYNKMIAEKEDFNFTEYYNQTKFSDVLKIDRDTIKHTASTAKLIARSVLM